MDDTLQAASDRFLESLRAKSPRTRSTYATGMRRFVAWAQDGAQQAEVTIDVVDDGALEGFYLALVDELGPNRESTLATYVAAARAFLRYGVREGVLSAVSIERAVERLRGVRPAPRYRTPRIDDGLAIIVDYVKNELPGTVSSKADQAGRLRVLRDRALLQVLYGTGMRRTEVSRLDRGDLDNGHAKQALITGKGRRERVVFFDDDACEAVHTYLEARRDPYVPVFIRHRGVPRDPGRSGELLRLSPQSIWRIVKRYGDAVGVSATTHDFRHFKATSLLNRGANLSEVQDILGHASPDTTKRIYAHYETAQLREVFDRFSVPVDQAAADARRRRKITPPSGQTAR